MRFRIFLVPATPPGMVQIVMICALGHMVVIGAGYKSGFVLEGNVFGLDILGIYMTSIPFCRYRT